MTETTAEEYWEDFYRERERAWTGKPNALLVREVADLAPGTALDLGCGEGGDALWLAERGWRVHAVDVSTIALARGAEHAAAAGVADRITWARHDLAHSFPEGSYDLVSAQFLHSPVAENGERDKILRHAADAVAPGGTLLIVAHAGWPTWMIEPPFFEFPTIPGTLAALALPPDEWRVETQDLAERDWIGPEGQEGRREDTVLRIRRLR
ncbi:class I SAM-dependent methyltransferase [Nocardia amikacinitolerans]|uniref:class I SAM-dependent methyltransferase n=1 Tax=Nocardia amikacinitolerans TaxID=756689 RepID=UPI0020A3E1A5|nr:class I SAM-dependent methyltransferase [Nocardia amikacinitolerans]MCP2291558.1 Methyltransferase domain-containing protein [Nocardia amikacinitolerans]